MDLTESTLRKHTLNILVNIDVDATFLCFLYSYPQAKIIDKLFMEDLMAIQSKIKRAFHLLMHIHRRGKQGFQALVEAMVYTEQRYLADQIDAEIAKKFWERRETHYPPF